MTYKQFKRRLQKAGLTIVEFAALLNMNKASITNYSVVGSVPDHLAVIVALMAAMADAEIDFRPVVESLGIERKLGRGSGFGGRAPVDDGE